MVEPQITEKTVGAFEIRRNFGRLLQGVLAKGDKYIIKRHGEAVAVVVPLRVYRQWKQNRAALFDTMRKTQKQASLTAEEADTLAREAVEVVRAANKDESGR